MPNRCRQARRLLFPRIAALAAGLAAGAAFGQSAPAPSPVNDLKNLSLEDLMEVEVTSVSRLPEKLLDAASAIQVVTGDDVRHSGATSLPEALRLAGNLEVAQENSHDWAISARGFDVNLADKLLVLIDGRAVYTPLYGGVLWNVQDVLLEDLDRIEVISGPGGVQWGANAMNGVINVTTKSARDTQGLYVEEAGAGAELQDATAVRYGGMLSPRVFYRVYGEYTDRGSEQTAGGANAADTSDMARGGFRIDSSASPATQLTLQGDAYNGTEFLGQSGDEGMSGGNLLGHWTHTTEGDSNMSLVAYYDRTHLSVPYAASPASPPYYAGFPASALVDDLDTADVDFQERLGSEDANQLVWGLSYRFTREMDRDLNLVQFEPNTLDQDLYGGFVEDRYALAPSLRLSAGTKLEHNDYTGWELEPSVRLAWKLAPNQLLWGAVSRAVRTPSRYDRDLVVPTELVNAPTPYVFPVNYLNGSPSYTTETELAYEIGYRVQLADRGSVSVSTYYNAYNHLKSTNATPTSATYPFALPVVFENGKEGYTSGAETAGDFKVTEWWRLHASYDLIREDIHENPAYSNQTGAITETADPKYEIAARSSFELNRDLDLDGGLRWVGPFKIGDGPSNGPLVATVPKYSELDLRLAWHPCRRFELSLVGQNLLHARHLEYGYPGAGTEYIRRAAYVKAEYRY